MRLSKNFASLTSVFFSEKLSIDYFISKLLFYLTVQRLLFQFVRVSSKILFKHAGYIQYNFITNLLLLTSPFTMCNLIVNRNCNNKYVKTYDKVWCNASNNVKIAFKHLFYNTMGLELI